MNPRRFQDRCIQPLCQASISGVLIKMAEAERFELSVGYEPIAGFQDRCIQPLCQASNAIVL